MHREHASHRTVRKRIDQVGWSKRRDVFCYQVELLRSRGHSPQASCNPERVPADFGCAPVYRELSRSTEREVARRLRPSNPTIATGPAISVIPPAIERILALDVRDLVRDRPRCAIGQGQFGRRIAYIRIGGAARDRQRAGDSGSRTVR
jgi:hypothetical protein